MLLLGLSDLGLCKNAQLLIERLIAAGVNVRVFKVTIEEISAILKNDNSLDGPIGSALTRGTLLPEFVAAVKAQPENSLKSLGVTIDENGIDHISSFVKYFTDEHYDEVFAGLTYHHDKSKARTHDAEVVPHIIRKRTGIKSERLFESKFVFLTYNQEFERIARRKCTDIGLLREQSIPPVVSVRFLAANLWMNQGFGPHQLEFVEEDIVWSTILASCDLLLQIKPDLVQRVEKIRDSSDDPNKKAQLDFILEAGRGLNIVHEVSLNQSSAVTVDNLAVVFEKMAELLVLAEREKGVAENERMRRSKQEMTDRLTEMDSQLFEIQAAEIAALQKAAEEAAKNCKWNRVLRYSIWGALAIIVVIGSYFSIPGIFGKAVSFIILLVNGLAVLLTFSGHSLGFVHPYPVRLESEYKRILEKRSLESAVDRYDFCFNQNGVVISRKNAKVCSEIGENVNESLF